MEITYVNKKGFTWCLEQFGLLGVCTPWDRLEDRTARSSLHAECLDLELLHLCKAKYLCLACKTGKTLLCASVAFDYHGYPAPVD